MSADFQVYVTFSGESEQPIQNVKALSSAGEELGSVLPSSNFNELRGMALFDDFLLVAQAHKKSSSIIAFHVDKSGVKGTSFVETLIDSNLSDAIWHPYALAVVNHRLFVSNQDSNVVSSYELSTTLEGGLTAQIAPLSTYLRESYRAQNFLPGTLVASSVPIEVRGKASGAVPATCGLSYTSTVQPSGKLKKHSVRGILMCNEKLYVADEPANRIAIFDANSGEPLGEVTKGSGSQNTANVLSSPVGLAYAAARQKIAISIPGNGAIFAYDPAHDVLSQISNNSALSASPGDDTVAMNKVAGIAYAPSGALFFASRGNQRIFKMQDGAITPFGPSFEDAPEALLIVARLITH